MFSESSRGFVQTAGLLLLACSIAAAARGQAKPAESELETGWHVVRPGETLQTITAFYLGSSARWEENWRLNSELANPHRIFPGQRLHILLPKPLPERTARLIEVSHQVDDRLRPNPWAEAWHDDLLRPQDGVRTFERSSAELAFGDGTRLLLTEQSLVFLWSGAPAQPKVDRQSIEVVEGQADLEAKAASTSAAPAGAAGIEIVLGDATAKPRPSPDGSLQTRARRSDTGGAQLMVYGGESELEAAGHKLTVAQGMGSNVAAGAPPSPPEKLLPAAELTSPPSRGQLALGDLTFRWQPVEGAHSYTVEVCGDPRCSRLVAKAKQLDAPVWHGAELPLGELFWRVTAVSASGLDGYPSVALPFAAVTELARAAPAPRAVALRFVGPQAECGGKLVVGPGAVPVLEPAASVVSSRLILDGREVASVELDAGLAAGEHAIVALVVDTGGGEQRLPPLAFVFDPEPPTLAWGRSGGPELGSSTGGEPVAGAAASAPATGAERLVELEWRTGQSGWIATGHRTWRYFADKAWLMLYSESGWWSRVRQGRRVVFEQPRIELRSVSGRVVLGGGAALDRGESLWIEAREGVCRVETLSWRVAGRSEQGPRLDLDATDSVGNHARIAWPLAHGR